MKLIFTAIAVVVASVTGTAALFSLAQHVVRNDERLLRTDDSRREALIARACGKHSTLWRSTTTSEYACRITNQDGEAIFYDVPAAPLLMVRQ